MDENGAPPAMMISYSSLIVVREDIVPLLWQNLTRLQPG